MNIESKLSTTSKNIKSSIIRELLKISDPAMISFGGGVPDPETFPREELAVIASEVVSKEYKFTLQYGTTEGDDVLKKQYIRLLEEHENIKDLNNDNLLITVGSQQALYLAGLTFLDEESYCGVTRPVYLAAASAFAQRNPKFISVNLSEKGIDTDYLESELIKLRERNELHKFKFMYVVTNFHNPAGITMPLDNRKKLIELAEKYDFIILEDDPYGALRFEGTKVPSIFSMNSERVIMLNTFSKILSPGMRIGVTIGNTQAIRRMAMAKQAVDLCCSPVTQRLTARFLERYDLFEQIKPTIELYKHKKDVFMKAMQDNLGDIKGVSWTKAEGGLFTWLTLPQQIDTMEMFEMAKKEKVLYIPGEAFFVDNPLKNTMRLSFCLPTEEQLVEGMKRLRRTIDKYCAAKGIKL